MSFGVIQYKSPFRCVPRHPDHVCAFCGTEIDVKYAYDVDDVEQYPEASRCDEKSVYSCSSCTLKKMYYKPDDALRYEFDISDPYKYMSTLQRMYSDLNKVSQRFHKKWVYCYGCQKYVLVADSVKDDSNNTLTCSDCGAVLKYEAGDDNK